MPVQRSGRIPLSSAELQPEVTTPAGVGLEASDSEGAPRRRHTVLLVEDYKDTSELLREWLERKGCKVLSASDGWEGLQLALRRRPDLILMDLSLPVMDGITVTDIIRAHEELGRVPIVALTAYDQVYPPAEADAARCDAYLTKPLDLGQLAGVMDRLLHGR